MCIIDLSSSTSDASDVTPASTLSSKKKLTPSLQTSLHDTYGDTLNQAGADVVIMAEVRAIVARGEPISRLLDPWVQASLLQRYPALSKFLPRNCDDIFDKYVFAIDKDSSAELRSFMKNIPGHANVGMDGVTVQGGKQKVNSSLLYSNVVISNLLLNYLFDLLLDCVHCIER